MTYREMEKWLRDNRINFIKVYQRTQCVKLIDGKIVPFNVIKKRVAKEQLMIVEEPIEELVVTTEFEEPVQLEEQEAPKPKRKRSKKKQVEDK